MAIEPQNAGMGTILMEQSRALEQNKTTTVKDIAAKSAQLDEQLILSNKEMNKLLNERLKFDAKDLDAIEKLTESIKDVRGPIARMVDGIKNFVRPIQDFVKNPGRGILKAVNFGGIFNKTIAKSEFIEQQKMLGSKKTNKELALDFGENYDSKRELKNINTKIQRFRDAGLSEEQIGRTEMGSQLLSQRSEALESLGNTDIRARFKTDDQFNTIAPKVDSSTGDVVGAAPSAEEKEQHLENVRQMEGQNEILEKIAANTSALGAGAAGNPQPAGGGGGGLMGKIGAGIKGFGDMSGSLLKGALGLVGIAGALWVISKALSNFEDLDFETLAKGVGTLGALAAIGIIAGKASGSMLMGALGLAAMSGVLFVASKAFEGFQDLDWETIGKGFIALAGIGAIGAIAGTAAPLILTGAVALGAMGGALFLIGEGMQAVGQGIKDLIDGLERMGNISGDNLLGVAAGIVAISGAMIAFAASNVVAGLGNLVTGLLSIGQDTPIEQLIKIGEAGAGIEAAARGLQGLSESMSSFGNVDTDKFEKAMDALDEAPWRNMTRFVQAGGYMNSDGTVVASASAMTQQARESATTGGGNVANVVAPVTNNNMSNNNSVIRPPVRNDDSSYRNQWRGNLQYSGAMYENL